MVETTFELMEYLAERGAPYGITDMELYQEIPLEARSPKVAYDYMQEKDISHIVPRSKGGDPAGENWVLEDSNVNRARGAETMTAEELEAAEADGKADAKRLEEEHKARQKAQDAKTFQRTVATAGTLIGTQIAIETALTAAGAAGAAAGAAAGCAVTGAVVTVAAGTALVGGIGCGLWYGGKWLLER